MRIYIMYRYVPTQLWAQVLFMEILSTCYLIGPVQQGRVW
jgi:hypothetical protein